MALCVELTSGWNDRPTGGVARPAAEGPDVQDVAGPADAIPSESKLS